MSGTARPSSTAPDDLQDALPGQILAAACSASSAGLCVVPPAEDGTKRPDCPWDEFKRIRPTRDQLRAWFVTNRRAGLGLVCGRVSGGLECFEFDDRAAYDQFKDTAQQTGLGDLVERIERGYCEDTPSGGVHWLYRTEVVSGNTKLARRPKAADEKQGEGDRVKVLIETRGEGGFVIVAPSGGPVHPSGHPYRSRSGGFELIATIQPDERDALFNLAQTFDEIPRREVHTGSHGIRGGRPGDEFNQRTTWADVLEPHGWHALFSRGETTYWKRPGKADRGMSATTNHAGSDLLWVFSTSTEFESERSYDKFAAYAVLNHGGDFSEAAKALAAQGYGKASPGAQQDHEHGHTSVVPLVPADRSEREPGAGPPDVETTLAQCDLADIPTPPSPANIAKLEQGLRRLRTVLKAADPLRIAAVAEVRSL